MRYGCRCGGALYRWWAVVAFLFAASCHAQSASTAVAQPSAASYNFERDRLPIASMDGLWRFMAGDDPDGMKGWASPGFNDSSWRLVRSGAAWVEQPDAAFAGPAWFRAKVVLPDGARSLAVYLPETFLNYQVYADGKLLGGLGPMPPRPSASITHPILLPLPGASEGRTVVLALRVWRWPQWNYFYKFALPSGIQIGDAHLLEARRDITGKGAAWDQVGNILLLVVELLFGAATLVLFALRRSEYTNLWFGVSLVLSAASRCWGVWPTSHSVSISTYYVVLQGLSSLTRLAQVFFYFDFLKGRRNWLFWSAVATASLIAIADYPLFFPAYFPARLAAVPIIAWTGLISALQAAPCAWIFTLLFQRVREGREDARLLLVPVVLKQSSPILFFISYWGFYGFSWRPTAFAKLNELSAWPFSFSFYDLSDGLFLVAMLAILIRRFVRTAAREEDYQRERDAAHIVQQVLIPEEVPMVPGFEVQSVYLPYGEVGGDFFQVIPSVDSSVLIAIGDVSGKGLPAAMTVALLVGIFRTCAIYNRVPGEILSVMNKSLTGRGNGGFTTCLVLRADPDGTLTIANAGHVSPYMDGRELNLECELPLGLAEEVTYSQACFHFDVRSELTLLTDGVIEARSPTGELYGFDRVAAIAREAAGEIARLAKKFGQDDDITVLKLVRLM